MKLVRIRRRDNSVPTGPISGCHYNMIVSRYYCLKHRTSSHPVGVAGKETINVVCELAFLVVLANDVKEVIGNIQSVFSVRDLDRTSITMIRCIPVKRFCLKGR